MYWLFFALDGIGLRLLTTVGIVLAAVWGLPHFLHIGGKNCRKGYLVSIQISLILCGILCPPIWAVCVSTVFGQAFPAVGLLLSGRPRPA